MYRYGRVIDMCGADFIQPYQRPDRDVSGRAAIRLRYYIWSGRGCKCRGKYLVRKKNCNDFINSDCSRICSRNYFFTACGEVDCCYGMESIFSYGVSCNGIFSVAVALLYRDSPEEVGEAPMFSDGIEDKAAEKQEEETGVSFREMFRTPQFYFLCLAYFIAGVVIYSVMSNMAIFSADHGFDSVTQGVVLSAMFTASAVMMIPAGAISDKYGTRITMLFCLGALILALIILMQDSLRDIMLYFAAVLVGIAYVGTNGPATISVREGLGTKDFDKKMPVVLGFMFAGVSLGNPILQCFYDIAGSYSRGFAIYIAGAAAAAVLIFLGTKPVQKL